MEEIVLKKIKINEIILDINNDKIYKYCLDKKDWQIYILYNYKDKELIPRNKIELIEHNKNILEQNIGKEIIIKTRPKTIIGTCIVNEELNLIPTKFYLEGKYYDLKNYDNLFEYYEDTTNIPINKSQIDFKKYISGLFKIYYDTIEYLFSMNNTIYIEKKETAMASYRAIRDNLTKYNFSEPNVFIKNRPLEYDALILNTKKNNNYYYKEDEIIATIEIKTSGYRSNKNSIDEYVNHIIDTNIYNERIESIPHIYFAIFEQPNNYKKLLKKFKNIIMIVCASKVNNNKFLIPKDYDIEKILKNLDR